MAKVQLRACLVRIRVLASEGLKSAFRGDRRQAVGGCVRFARPLPRSSSVGALYKAGLPCLGGGSEQDRLTFNLTKQFLRVIALDRGGFLHGLDALGVHRGRGGFRVATRPLPFCRVQASEDKMPQPIEAESPEMVVDGGPRREVAREQAPRAAAPQDVEYCVEDVTQAMGARSTRRLRWRETSFQASPFLVGKLRWVLLAHAQKRIRAPQPSPLPNTL
jgi:hypothetical protein